LREEIEFLYLERGSEHYLFGEMTKSNGWAIAGVLMIIDIVR